MQSLLTQELIALGGGADVLVDGHAVGVIRPEVADQAASAAQHIKEYKKNNSSIEPIIITTYSKVKGNKIAVVKITDEKEIEKFLSMTKDIVILDGPRAVDLFVITEVKVSYKNLRIYTQKDYEYCYYRAENSNESPLAMMSSDLVNFIKKYTNDIG